ncbi:phosphonate ABC transporter ATP-binding protein [Clostridium tunisiense]|uniref:phosphonate ABC transporter ATP-binding protein n=1 Tax=Clostridium tunisiense TaxID=219748 RepID=UPI0002E753D9|nr:phosphonate ABC transporter ATP-binding protein [Clostridium tunisiense]
MAGEKMNTETNNLFEINNISKIYERKIALDSLSINIKKGEIVALIGPSGAGKTTLLNILATVLNTDKGEILLDGNNIESYKGVKELAKKIGIIRQQFDLVGSLPVIHNVLAGRLKDWGFLKSLLSLLIPQDKELAIKALERVGIEEKAYERTSKLSGGEQQRVAMARLLVQNPEVILADEPVSSLDPARAEDILYTLTNLVREEGQTLIASLHSVEYAKKYFNRIIALREGRIYFDLPVEKVTSDVLKELYDLKELKEDAQS